MPIYGPNYTFAPIISTLVDADTTQHAITGFKDAFLAAGWILVASSAGSGGTIGYELISYPTPAALVQMRVKFSYNGATTPIFGYPIIQIQVTDSNGASSFSTNFLTIRNSAGVKTSRCIVNRHQFFIFLDTTISPNSAYATDSFNINTAMGGVPVLFDTTLGQQAFWFLKGGFNLDDFRTDLSPDSGTSYAYLIRGTFNSGTNNVNTIIAPELLSTRSSELLNSVPFLSGNYPVQTPILMLGTTTVPIAVSLWDSFVAGVTFASRVTPIADFHVWENVTLGGQVGTLFAAIENNINLTRPGYSY